MDPRQELELLRKHKRLQELEAKAQGHAPAAEETPVKKEPYKSPGENSLSDKISDPNRWKAILTGKGPASQEHVGDDLGAAALAIPAESAPAGLMKIAQYLGKSGIMPSLARAGTNAAIGGLQGGAKGAALGAGLSLGGDAVSGASSKIADYLAQRGVGMRKYVEGVGNNLVDQNMFGTKGGMSNQIADKLPAKELELNNLVSNMPGETGGEEFANEIQKVGSKFKTPGQGFSLKVLSPDVNAVEAEAGNFAPESIGAQGPAPSFSNSDVLNLKRQGDYAGFTNSGTPASSTQASIGRAVGDKARSVLSSGSGGETARLLDQEKALVLAKRALEKDPTLIQGYGSNLIWGKLPGESIFDMAGAHAVQKGVKPAANLASDPLVIQSLIKGLFNNSSEK